MSMATYYLLHHPDKLTKLRDELSNVRRNDNGLLEYKDVKDLPYLVSESRCKRAETEKFIQLT